MPGAAACAARPPPAAADRNPRLRRRQLLGHFVAGDVQRRGVPRDRQRRALVRQIGGLAHGRLHAVDGRDPLRDRVEPGEPGLPFGGVIALHPRLDRRQHAERLLAAHLVVAPRAVMRRAGLPRRQQDVLAAEQQPGALRTADRLAAAVGDDGGAALQVHVGNRQHFGGRIDEDRDVLRLGDRVPPARASHWARCRPSDRSSPSAD